MLVRYRSPKRSIVLPVVTTVAVATLVVTTPLATTFAAHHRAEYHNTNGSDLSAIPAQLAEVALASTPDVVLPLRELTGLNLPDLHLSDLKRLPLPSSIPVPPGLPLPPGVQLPAQIPLPRFNPPQQGKNPGQGAPQAQTPGTPPTPTAPAPAASQAPGAPAPDRRQGQPVALTDPATAPIVPAGDPTSAEDSNAPAVIPGADPAAQTLAPDLVSPELADKVGAQVKELTRDEPFSMIALTAKDMAGTTAMIRSQNSGGGWGPWYRASQVDTGRNDHISTGKTGTEPVYVGTTKAVQVLLTHKAMAPNATNAVPVPARSDDPALIADPDLSVLIDPGRGANDSALSTVAAALPGGGPKVITRDQWGADPKLLCQKPTYDDGLGGITVHHTAGRNDYTAAESAGIVRAIYAYHAKTLGWCDIGYNALVDKYGQIFEGRAGGLDKPVEGAHAGGFNENTSGVALMGDFQSGPPTDAAIHAIGQFIGWRAKIAGLNPQSSTTMYSEGTQYSKYAQGQAVRLPIVFAHRDVGKTACPGNAAYALMDRIRAIAANAMNAVSSSPGTDAKAIAPENNSGTAPATVPAPLPATRSKSQRTQEDLQTLAALTTKLLGLIGRSPVAKYWAGQGGPDSRFGAATAEPASTPDGGQIGKFINGYIYASPDGTIIELAGRLLDRFVQLGGESGLLGLPLTNAYPVPDGMRTDFQYGSLIVNTATQIVTTLYKIYTDTAGANPAAAFSAPVSAPGQPTEPSPVEGP
jgi:uncharacterized protein with LGFP repeats